MEKINTWFVDLDGTLVYQNSHFKDKDTMLPGTINFFKNVIKKDDVVIITTGRTCEHRERIDKFFKENGLRYDILICDLPTGKRILVNDKKTDGALTAFAYNLERDKGIKEDDFSGLPT